MMLLVHTGSSQTADKIITEKEVALVEKTLSSDEMSGRKPGTPAMDKAASFIRGRFDKAGLRPLPDAPGFLQSFSVARPTLRSIRLLIGSDSVPSNHIAVFSPRADVQINDLSAFEQYTVKPGEDLRAVFSRYYSGSKDAWIWVDPSHDSLFGRLRGFRPQLFNNAPTLVFVLRQPAQGAVNLSVLQELAPVSMANVVGMIPGKSKPNEYVIFSAHYDHLGIGKPSKEGDSIYNGANDDASGTTAVILLAQYFAAQKNNARTLIFAAFTAEESGGFGSNYFSKKLPPDSVIAMFNIEMIGTESKWGTNSAFITGYEKTDMGQILEKNLQGSKFKFYPDPYPDQQLFYRSDNATLARLGVPAHTISTSKMDSEKFYHTVDDEFETLDMKNMTEIIKAIATSSRTIVAGQDTPTRVDTKSLR